MGGGYRDGALILLAATDADDPHLSVPAQAEPWEAALRQVVGEASLGHLSTRRLRGFDQRNNKTSLINAGLAF